MGSKVVFVEPPAPGLHIYSKFPLPLLGPLVMGRMLKENGHEVTVLNGNFGRIEPERIDADVLVLTCLSSTSKEAYAIADRFRASHPGSRVLMGGPHVSFRPEEALEHADQVAVGEGENVIVEMVEGRITERVVRGPPVRDMNALPFPDFSLMGSPRMAVRPVQTSRGCPFDCSFCTVTQMYGRTFRYRSAENVLKELRTEMGFRTLRGYKGGVFFYDDNFSANPARAKALLRGMIDQGPPPFWITQARTDVVNDVELLDLMVESNCRTLFIGLESVNEETLKTYNKRQRVKDIIRALDILHDRGFSVHGMFAFGADTDTPESMASTAEFCRVHGVDSVQFLVLTPLPGSHLFNSLVDSGRIFTYNWRFYDAHHALFLPKNMNAYELMTGALDAMEAFYTRGRTISRALHGDLLFAWVNHYARGLNRTFRRNNRTYLEWLESMGDRLKLGSGLDLRRIRIPAWAQPSGLGA